MRFVTVACLLCFNVFFVGCGGSETPTTASAGAGAPGAAPPPPPGGDSGDGSGQPMDGGDDGSTPDGGQPPASDSAEPMAPDESAPSNGNPDGANPPPDSGDNGQPSEENPDGTPRRPARPQTLLEQAFAAFQSGSDLLGQRLLNAHYVVVADAKQDLAKKMAWFPALSRPALNPRIGVAVHYLEAPRDFRGDPMPIGSDELKQAVQQWEQRAAAERGIGGNRRSGRQSAGGAGADGKTDTMRNQSGAAQLSFYTGEFGQLLLDALEERFETGEYGRVTQEVFQESSRGRRRPTRGNPNDPNAAFGGDPSLDGQDGDQPGGRRAQAASALDGIEEGEGRARRWTTRAAAQEAASLQQIKQISPCILWLGKEDDRDEIIKRVEAAKIDILFIFEMTVREARAGDFVNNKTTLRMLTTKGSKPVPGYTPEPLGNVTVEQWRQKEEKGLDPVEREITKVIEALDPALKPTALPAALNEERAKKRIGDLVAEKPADPLPVLVEARFYAAKGLLPEEEFDSAATTLLGQSGFAQLKEKAKIGTE